VELTNTGSLPWTRATTFLGTTGPRDRESPFLDSENWVGSHRPTAVDQDTAPGEVGRFSFMLHAPEVSDPTAFAETFGLVEEGVAWFGPEDVTLEIMVSPAGGGGGGDGDPEGGVDGGCAVSGGGAPRSPWAFLLLGVVLLLRRLRF
jgi:MYXO-CTERM domain-containing protein